MGEVYRARDPRLDREVALKVLPAEFAADAERLARFEREAQAAAALNHPNIAVVFDIGDEDGTRYIVQEYLRGVDLRQRLDKGALPLQRSLRLATGIARGLAAAHRADVVHRDLKPENVFVTDDGEAKILDFGLAKSIEVEGAAYDAEPDAATELQTAAGLVMGTPGYMAPEQIEARPVDARTDLFAFGCLLYEIVSGVRAFHGDSAVQTMNRIVHEQPRPLNEIAVAPPELQRIVGKCLAKDPRRRYQTAADLVIDLEALAARVDSGEGLPVSATGAGAGATGSTSPRRRLPAAWAVGLAGLAAVAGIGLGWLVGRDRPAPAPASHVALVERIAPRNDPGLAISPDGRTVVFVGADDVGREGLFVRSLDEPDARAIPGTGRAHSPGFSPDGRWVAYFDDENRTLRKVDTATGEIRELCSATGSHIGLTWTDQGTIVFASFEGGLGVVEGESGGARLLAAPTTPSSDVRYQFPRYVPGGGDVLVTVGTAFRSPGGSSSIAVVDGRSGAATELLQAASDPRFLYPDRLLFRRQDALYVVGFDAASRSLVGEPAVFRRGVAETADGPFVYDVSSNGTLVLLRAEEYPARNQRTVVAVDRAGRETPLLTAQRNYGALRAAPGGRRLAVQIGSPSKSLSEVWLHDLETRRGAPLITQEAFNPVWGRDGEWVAVALLPSASQWKIVLHKADLSGERLELELPPELRAPEPLDFGVGNRTLMVQNFGGRDATWLVSLDGAQPPRVLMERRVHRGPSLSPDERWIAFASTESGVEEIYVMEIATGRRWPVSNGGGSVPRWRADGGELFYWRDQALFATKVRADAAGWGADPPELLFEGSYVLRTDGWSAWDPAPDGERFYLIRDDGPPGWQPTRLELVLNASTLVDRALAGAR